MLAVADAPELERELERLHEADRADHVVVVERAPAVVRVLVPEQPDVGEQRRVLGQRLAVHDQVLPVHVHLDVLDPTVMQRVDHVQGHADVAHQDLHRGLGVLVLEEELHAVAGADLRGLGDPVQEPPPALGVGRLERVVVALDPGPDDEVRSDRAGELGRLAGEAARVGAQVGVGGDESASPEARIEVQAARDAVDAVLPEFLADRLEQLRVQLLRVVELVVVDQPLEAGDGAPDAGGHVLVRPLRLVPAGHEARHHRPEGPDPETRAHQRPSLSRIGDLSSSATARCGACATGPRPGS